MATGCMLYFEHKPDAPLSHFVRSIWCFRAPQTDHPRERILPTGRAQIILSLSRDFLIDCPEGFPEQRTAPSLIVGQRSVYEIVDTSDFADLIGIVFEPAVLPALVSDRADLFSNCSTALEQVWGRQAHILRDCLRTISSPQKRLRYVEQFLLAYFLPRMHQPRFALHPAVEFALHRFGQTPTVANVTDVARNTGWSLRRFSQLFREQVGFTPKTWCRLARFQHALQQLRAGREIRWAEVAIECGFYDQSHFANEFRAFSGIDLSTYTKRRSPLWANHVRDY